MYTSLPPGRSIEYTTMQFQFLEGDLCALEPAMKESNWLFFTNDHKKALLYIGSHKTFRSIGVQKIKLSSENATSMLLDVCMQRPILVNNKVR